MRNNYQFFDKGIVILKWVVYDVVGNAVERRLILNLWNHEPEKNWG